MSTTFKDLAYSFLMLPPELRSEIYRCLMAPPNHATNDIWITANGGIQSHRRSSQMLRTCKTVYAEALPILYSSNLFVAESLWALKQGLDRLSTKPQSHIRQIMISAFFVWNLEYMLQAGAGITGIYQNRLVRLNDINVTTAATALKAFSLPWQVGHSVTIPQLPSLRQLTLRFHGNNDANVETKKDRSIRRLSESNPACGNIVYDSLKLVGLENCVIDLDLVARDGRNGRKPDRRVVKVAVKDGQWIIEEIDEEHRVLN